MDWTNAKTLDSKTFAGWIQANLRCSAGRAYFQIACEAVFAAEPADMSLLHAAFYAKSGGSLETLMSVDQGAQQDRINGGSALIAERFADRVRQAGGEIRLGQIVRTIEHNDQSVTVTTRTTGEDTKITWSSNWDDDLAGSVEHGHNDPILKKVGDKIKFEYEQAFMFYLPRICEHCLNPSCVAACPTGAIYKREEDGIVLVDQDRCRGWRQCVTGCPYKKMYFNNKTGKVEKCTFCYPRIELGQPTICSETCVGRLRYLGLMLYDADRVLEAASTPDEHGLYEAQRSVFLDPHDPEVIREAKRAGIADDWIEAAGRSPIWL